VTDLSEFELREQDHTDLFGIFLGVHAVPGTVLFLHTTIGCKFKTQMHLVEHDWFRESHNQRLWTGVDDVRLIAGSGQRLIEFATSWYERRRPSLAVITTNAAVGLSDLDVEQAVEELRRRLPCPVILLKAPGYIGSIQRGYKRFLEAVLALLDWDRTPKPNRVAIVGYVFDRYERDHAANLREIQRLLESLGLDLSATMFGGQPLDRLKISVPEASTIALFPLAHDLQIPGGRQEVQVPMPLGLRGTSQFLYAVGEAAGVDRNLIESVVEREMRRAVPAIAKAASHLEDLRVGVFLDSPMAEAVTAFLLDLGVEVPFVSLTDPAGADESRFRERVSRLAPPGSPLPQTVLCGASRNQAVRKFLEVASEVPIPVVVGSAFHRAVFRRRLISVVELGFPAAGKHAIYPTPFLGFNGAVALTQRILDAAFGAF